MSLQHVANFQQNQLNGELLEQVILGNDLARLTPGQKVEYVKGLCKTIGLNPITKPIQLIKFQGKEVPYFTKDASEQLRKINGVSIMKVDTQVHSGGLYVVTAYASDKSGRQDCSTAAIVIDNLRGDALANAMMKAETKAKRRVTLSICGLGFMDELETETLPKAQKIDIATIEEPKALVDEQFTLDRALAEIAKTKTMEALKHTFEDLKKSFARKSPELLQEIVEAKDIRKIQLQDELIDIDMETGEIVE